MQQDLLKFLQILSEQGAEFIIVGGVAAFLHGGNRVTYDIDQLEAIQRRISAD
jgi:hypothetical protein